MGVFSKHDDDDLYMGFVVDGGPIPEDPREEKILRASENLKEARRALKLLSLVRKRIKEEVFVGNYDVLHENGAVKKTVWYVACTDRFLRKFLAACEGTKMPKGIPGSFALNCLLEENGYILHQGRVDTLTTRGCIRDLVEWADPTNRWNPERELRNDIRRMEETLRDYGVQVVPWKG
jgi:hypothetical protein